MTISEPRPGAVEHDAIRPFTVDIHQTELDDLKQRVRQSRSPERELVEDADEGRFASFDRATGWLNTEPLTAKELRGRVVLASFWTYTCVNWLRTLPYLAAWNAKYAAAGLTVVGIHTPEFDFEGDQRNVADHARRLGIDFPIAIDTDYGIWDDFANHYWPAIYLADVGGRTRYHHFGEGEYADTETAIQQLLAEAGARDVDSGLVDVDPEGLQVAADWASLRSPETYLGYGQSSGFVSEDESLYDRPHLYVGRKALPLNSWDLAGNWTVTRRAAELGDTGGRIRFAFHARDVNLVMAPGTRGEPIPFRVELDGHAIGEAHGTDTDAAGRGAVDNPNTYQLVRQAGPISDHIVEIEFLKAGVAAYCVTFG